jgi:hypothetical protein
VRVTHTLPTTTTATVTATAGSRLVIPASRSNLWQRSGTSRGVSWPGTAALWRPLLHMVLVWRRRHGHGLQRPAHRVRVVPQQEWQHAPASGNPTSVTITLSGAHGT